jgi:hypothetical protein|tara:strand:- start:422 stop:550 length:129 start_codon:yes stop_codon:yes gene_type:complete
MKYDLQVLVEKLEEYYEKGEVRNELIEYLKCFTQELENNTNN